MSAVLKPDAEVQEIEQRNFVKAPIPEPFENSRDATCFKKRLYWLGQALMCRVQGVKIGTEGIGCTAKGWYNWKTGVTYTTWQRKG